LARLLSPASVGFFIVIFGRSDDGGFSLTVANSSGDISYRRGPEKPGLAVVEFVAIAGGRAADPDAGRGGAIADGAGGGGGGAIAVGAGADGGGGGVIAVALAAAVVVTNRDPSKVQQTASAVAGVQLAGHSTAPVVVGVPVRMVGAPAPIGIASADTNTSASS